MLSEAIPTLILVLTVLITTLDKKKRRLSPLAIGFSIIVCSVTRYGVFLKNNISDFNVISLNFVKSCKKIKNEIVFKEKLNL